MLVVWLGLLVHTIYDSVISMSLYVLLQVLRPFEGLGADRASMRLQRYVDSDMRRDVVTFDHLNMAITPRALQVEVVGTLATDVFITHMLLTGGQQRQDDGREVDERRAARETGDTRYSQPTDNGRKYHHCWSFGVVGLGEVDAAEEQSDELPLVALGERADDCSGLGLLSQGCYQCDRLP